MSGGFTTSIHLHENGKLSRCSSPPSPGRLGTRQLRPCIAKCAPHTQLVSLSRSVLVRGTGIPSNLKLPNPRTWVVVEHNTLQSIGSSNICYDALPSALCFPVTSSMILLGLRAIINPSIHWCQREHLSKGPFSTCKQLMSFHTTRRKRSGTRLQANPVPR